MSRISQQQLESYLWGAATLLRGTIDAGEYKHVVLGLIFLKYISDTFEFRREELKAELIREGINEKQLEPLRSALGS